MSTRRSVGRRSLESLLVLLIGLGVLPALAAGGIVDCNGNGVDDATDISNGTSEDCNFDGVPDECGVPITCTRPPTQFLDPPPGEEWAETQLVGGAGASDGWVAWMGTLASGSNVLVLYEENTSGPDPVLEYRDAVSIPSGLSFAASDGVTAVFVDSSGPGSPSLVVYRQTAGVWSLGPEDTISPPCANNTGPAPHVDGDLIAVFWGTVNSACVVDETEFDGHVRVYRRGGGGIWSNAFTWDLPRANDNTVLTVSRTIGLDVDNGTVVVNFDDASGGVGTNVLRTWFFDDGGASFSLGATFDGVAQLPVYKSGRLLWWNFMTSTQNVTRRDGALFTDELSVPVAFSFGVGMNDEANVLDIFDDEYQRAGTVWTQSAEQTPGTPATRRWKIGSYFGLPAAWNIDEDTSMLTGLDCNCNGIADSCDIFDGAPDCNGNIRPDSCDIDDMIAEDCNMNDVIDECELLDCPPGDLSCGDCNENGVLDGCETDSDLDGVIDDCDQCPGADDIPDCDNDGTPDCVVIDTCDGSPACDDCDLNGIPDGCEVNVMTEYAIDDGSPNGSLGLNVAADFAWFNEFTVEAGATSLTQVRVMFNQMPVGTPIQIVVWDDPNNDGDPIDATTIQVVDAEITRNDAIYADYDIPTTDVGAAGDTFFVGVFVTVNNQFPARRDSNNPQGRSWVAAHNPGALDLNDLSGGGNLFNLTQLDPSLNGNFMVRAIATANPDCNENGRQDSCDIDLGSSLDENMDGIPDECAPVCPAPPAPTAEASGIPRNRYLSMNLGNPVGQYAVRVTLPASDPNSGGVAITQFAGIPLPAREAQNPDDTFDVSLLQCTPHFQDWSAFDLLDVYGPNVVPGSAYEVELVPDCCADPFDRTCGSATLLIPTAEQWADVVAPFQDSGSNQPDINDILAIIDKLLGQNPPLKVEAQLQPAALNPDDTIKIADVLDCIDAFLGAGYPYNAPAPCP